VKKHLIYGLILVIFCVAPLSATNVSFLVMETGLPKDGPSSPYTIMWENGLMDVFFEYGHIVSNSPIMRIFQKPLDGFPDEAERDFDDAKEGGMRYFVIAIVEHPIPYKVSLRLFNTSSQEMLRELVYTYKTPKTEKEENDNIKKAVAEIAARLK